MKRTRGFSSLSSFLDDAPGAHALAIALIATIAALVYWLATCVPVECTGAGDCVKYLDLTQSFRHRTFHPINAPFNLRILVPWIISVFSSDPTRGFVWVNCLSILVFTWCWHGIARTLQLRNLAFFSLLIWFFIHPLGFHLYFVVPAHTDPASYAFIALITLLFLREQWLALCVSLFFALLVKESFTFIGLIVLAAGMVRMVARRNIKAALPLMVGVLCVLFVYTKAAHAIIARLFPYADEFPPSTVNTITYWVGQVSAEPARLIVWLSAILCVTGTFLSMLAARWINARNRPPLDALAYFALGSLGFIALGILAGSDMSRIIFNGNLFTITLCLIAARSKPFPTPYLLGHLLASGVIALTYTRFITSTIEYDYYTQNHRLLPTICFIVATLAAMLMVEFFYFFRHGSQRARMTAPATSI